MKNHIITPKNRFFNALVVYISSVSSIGIVLEGYAQDRLRVELCKDEDYVVIAGKPEVSGIEFKFKPAPILKALAKNLWPESIEIEEAKISAITPCKHLLTNLHSIHGAVISNCFISFYDEFHPRVNPSPLWQFAYAIRCGLAHNGKILIKDPDKTVRWKTLEFAYSDNGKPLLYEELTAVELIVLMMELDSELSSRAN